MKKGKFSGRILLIVVCLLVFTASYSQDLSGYWQGEFRTDQRFNGRHVTFFMNMVLGQNGRKILGRFANSALDFPNNPDVVYEISGIIGKKDKIPSRLIRNEILYNRLPGETAEYFLSLDQIEYIKNDTMEVLRGYWSANGLMSLRSDGYAGGFWVRKLHNTDSLATHFLIDTSVTYHPDVTIAKDPVSVLIPDLMIKRKNIQQGDVVVNTKSIFLQLYDNGIVDDDSVSIFFNGKLLLSHQRISETPIVLNIELDENNPRNELLLFAENLGRIPPNTALIIVTAGDKRFELFSKADMNENAVLLFRYQPK